MLLLFLKATLKSNQLVNYQKNGENKYFFSKIHFGGGGVEQNGYNWINS